MKFIFFTSLFLLTTVLNAKYFLLDGDKPILQTDVLKESIYSQNNASLFKKLEILAKKGDALSQFSIAKMYQKGIEVSVNKQISFYWFNEAAKQDVIKAQLEVVKSLELGIGTTKDIEKAILGYIKLAEKYDVEAQYRLAKFYLKGIHISKDIALAFFWFQKAANKGSADAQYSLALIFLQGDGTKKDYKKAVKWFKKAAEQGHINAQYSLSLRYALGQGVEKDYKQKIFWLSKAANQGNKEAQYSYALHLINQGELKEAQKLLEQSAKQGFILAHKKLVVLYKSKPNKEVVKQKEEVIENPIVANNKKDTDSPIINQLLKKAINGDLEAQNNLGVLYTKGNIVKKDKKKAFFWIEKAAKAGLIDALNNIAVLYIVGNVVEVDFKKSYEYAKQSSDKGSEKGKLLLKFLEERSKGIK